MDQILLGVENCVCKQDDILIGGNDWQENLRILADVLDRLHKYNLHLKLPKCEFLKPEVVYLGLRISAEGLQPVEEKINAVKQAPAPQNVSELRSSGHGPVLSFLFARPSHNFSTSASAFAEKCSMGMDR